MARNYQQLAVLSQNWHITTNYIHTPKIYIET